jgi:hypothetical protein
MRSHVLAGFEKYAQRYNKAGVTGGTLDAFSRFAATQGRTITPQMTQDAAVAGGLAFLQSELERIDPKVREPLMSVTWMRDVPVKSGGGWIDFTSVFNVDYGISGPNQYGLMANQNNQIPVIQANIDKDIYKVFNWGNVMKMGFIDMQKLQTAGRSLEDLLDKGIRTNWNKTLDAVTYLGPTAGYPGLVNNPLITAGALAAVGNSNGYVNTTRWAGKTILQMLADVNTIQVSTWSAGQFDTTSIANHFLIPPADYALLLQPVTAAGSDSGLEYLLKNNIGKTQGVELKIFPSRWCIGAGAGGSDRMVAYVNDDDRVQLDVPVPCNRVMTQPTVEEGGAYLTLYLGQIGVVKFLYTQPAAYGDGI